MELIHMKIFIHIPKNGGITIGRASKNILGNKIIFGKAGVLDDQYVRDARSTKKWNQDSRFGHARWRDYKQSVTDKHPAFAFIRNPWSKVISRYTYAMLRRPKFGGKRCSLEEFIEERHECENIPFYWHRAISGWYQQLDHVTSTSGELKCDILRFEHYSEDTVKYLNLQSPLPAHNVSNGNNLNGVVVNKKDYKEFYNNTTREIIAQWYKPDIDFFGFVFDGAATKNIWNTK